MKSGCGGCWGCSDPEVYWRSSPLKAARPLRTERNARKVIHLVAGLSMEVRGGPPGGDAAVGSGPCHQTQGARRRKKVAAEMAVSRNTVRHYLTVAEPKPVRQQARRRPVLERVQKRMDELIEEWRTRTTAKQRMTGTRLQRELVREGYQVGVTLVRAYLRERRRREAEVYIPLVHRPGDEAQGDFFEVVVEVDGERRKAWKFLMRLMYSGHEFAWLYERGDQLAFLDGHVRAFAPISAPSPGAPSTTT